VSDDVDPKRTHVVSIGIEDYENAMFPPLAGVAKGATRFAQWAIAAGVKPANVRLASSPAAHLAGNLAKVASYEATFGGIETLFLDLRGAAGDLLLVYWAGHGVLNNCRQRVLFTSDSDEVRARYFRVDNLHDFLASDRVPGFDRNVLFIDACANFAHEINLDRSMANATFENFRGRRIQQWTLFSAAQGEYAQNDAVNQQTAFSAALLPWLKANSGIPIDFYAAVDHVTAQLKKLSDDGTTMQHPVRREVRTPFMEGWEPTMYGEGMPVSGREQKAAGSVQLTIRQLHRLNEEMRRFLGMDDAEIREALLVAVGGSTSEYQDDTRRLITEVHRLGRRDAFRAHINSAATSDQARDGVGFLMSAWDRHAAVSSFLPHFGAVPRPELMRALTHALGARPFPPPIALDDAMNSAAEKEGPPEYMRLIRFVVALEAITGARLPDATFERYVDAATLEQRRLEAVNLGNAEARLVIEVGSASSPRPFTWPQELTAHVRGSDGNWTTLPVVPSHGTKAGVHQAVQELVLELSRTHDTFSIGFLVPRAAIDVVIESWKVQPNRYSAERPLWYDHTTTLHIAERGTNKDLVRVWRRRVESIRESLDRRDDPSFDWIDTGEDVVALQARITRGAAHCQVFKFRLGKSPARILRDPLLASMGAGAPYVLWMVEPPTDWTDAQAVLDDVMGQSTFYDLPELVRDLRQRDPDGLGRNLRLVWDDPDVLPKLPWLSGIN